SSQVLVAPALFGDSDLSGTVDTVDFNYLAANFGKPSGAIWAEGDYNYDDHVDTNDFSLLAANFGQTLSLPSASLAGSEFASAALVPEPSTAIALLLAAIPGLISQRKRRNG